MIMIRSIFKLSFCLIILTNKLFAIPTNNNQYSSNQFTNQLYSYNDQNGTILPNGDSNYNLITLDTPVNFFSEKYDHIYINTNGILTFVTELPDFLNQPIPLEYPSIAPFYSNVDTSANNNDSLISFHKSENQNELIQATDLVQFAFSYAYDFQATTLYVATWKNVGYYNAKTDLVNTFQVVIICSQDESYVQFIYPNNGLNWLQAEVGEHGLPDIRSQAGLMSEDGRFYTLDGSGTDNARYLNTQSNIGVPGVWVFRVGALDYSEDIALPDISSTNIEIPKPSSCSNGYYQQCHSSAKCIDTHDGYCCRCNEGYYGNGINCIKDKIPLRVAGTISGTINNNNNHERISSKLQSYVVLQDGRTYTAINPVNPEYGRQLQLALPLGSVIGWLFAKPIGTGLNGYQLTGGKLKHVSILTFTDGEIFAINQTFDGLDYWDQLSIKIEFDGTLPYVPVDTRLQVKDFIEEYNFISLNEIQSIGNRQIEVPEENRTIEFNLEQTITFDYCRLDNEIDGNLSENGPILQKISKFVLDYNSQEHAIRVGMLNKIGVDRDSNPCTDGTANCGENTLCIPQGDEYDCVCQNGYAPNPDSGRNSIENCVDIDECHGSNICDENAFCNNLAGGYSCTCYEGYEGNGHECMQIKSNIDGQQTEQEPPHYNYNYYRSNERDSECNRCSEFSVCFNNVCLCKEGWSGDGYNCSPLCLSDESWVNGRCLPAHTEDDNEIQPFCDMFGECTCIDGYDFIDEDHICRINSDEIENETKPYGQIPCDVADNCHENATCNYSEEDYRHYCVCMSGFEGDGITCTKVEASCTTQEDICDKHASCVYNEMIGKSQCKCDSGYEGNGFVCHLAPECTSNEHCSTNAFCDKGVCLCLEGFERDISDFCVPTGSCGGTYCADNAICKWESIQQVSYCECLEGYIGDGVSSCKSIPPPCNIRNTCGLYASCIQNHLDSSKYECLCDSGYYGDGYVCVEEKNCRNTPHLCDPNAKCVQSTVGLQCICNSGFLGNGTYCKVVSQHESGFLIISQGVVVIRIPFDGKLGRPISVAQMAIGLDKDCTEGRIYWGDISAKKIMSSKYDGTDAKPFIINDVSSPEGIAVDWLSRRLYWTDSTKDTIEVANLDNPQQRSVIVNKFLVNPRGIAVDPHKNKLYWSDWNRDEPKIEMSDLDGTGREILLSKPSVILPNSLTILRNTGDLCYADAGTHKIECYDTYTKQIRTIASNLTYPFGLTSTDEHFYWTDWISKQIESVDIYGTRKQGMRTPVFGSHKMYGMTAITDDCSVSYSPCQINNGGCPEDRLCLVNTKAPSSKSCKCTSLSSTCNDVHLDI